MSNVQALDSITHRDVTVAERLSSALGDGQGSAMLVPSEVAEAHREFPIFFRKDPKTGQFFISALLGLNAEDNLFIENGAWRSRYIPRVLKRGPFYIGSGNNVGDTGVSSNVIYINHSDSRVNGDDGKRLFDANGNQTRFAMQLFENLHALHEGFQQGSIVCHQLSDLGLIEPVSIDIVLDSKEALSLTGLFTINQEKLIALEGTILVSLNQSGILPLAYDIINSLGNVKVLIDRSNNK